jgi:hypothetical protein
MCRIATHCPKEGAWSFGSPIAYKQPEVTYERALRAMEEALGVELIYTDAGYDPWADHPDTLTSIANLTATYREQDRFDKAEILEVGVMEISRIKLGTDRMANVGFTWRSQGRCADALAPMESYTQARQRVLGERQPDTISPVSTIESWR